MHDDDLVWTILENSQKDSAPLNERVFFFHEDAWHSVFLDKPIKATIRNEKLISDLSGEIHYCGVDINIEISANSEYEPWRLSIIDCKGRHLQTDLVSDTDEGVFEKLVVELTSKQGLGAWSQHLVDRVEDET